MALGIALGSSANLDTLGLHTGPSARMVSWSRGHHPDFKTSD